MGSYNSLLQNSLPEPFRYCKAEEETFESSHEAFKSAFPRDFAWEVIKVDESLRAEEVEVYYDPTELLGGLLSSGTHK